MATDNLPQNPSSVKPLKGKKPTAAQLQLLLVLAYPGAYIDQSWQAFSIRREGSIGRVPNSQDIKTNTIKAVVGTTWVTKSKRQSEFGTTTTYILSPDGEAEVEHHLRTHGSTTTVAEYRARIIADEQAKAEAEAKRAISTEIEYTTQEARKPFHYEGKTLLVHSFSMGACPTKVSVREGFDYVDGEITVTISVDEQYHGTPADKIPHLITLLTEAKQIAERRAAELNSQEVK